MRLLQSFLLGAHLSTVLALPKPQSLNTRGIPMGKESDNGTTTNTSKDTSSNQDDPAATDLPQTGKFGVNLAVGGATETNTDTLFTAADTGALEVEVQMSGAGTLTAEENLTPTATAVPSGFQLLDKSTYKLQLTPNADAEAPSVQKIEYVLDATNPDVTAIPDLSQTRIAKLNPLSKTFEVENIGELAFEAKANELSLTVEDVTGEYAILAPAVAPPLAKRGSKGAAKVIPQSVGNETGGKVVGSETGGKVVRNETSGKNETAEVIAQSVGNTTAETSRSTETSRAVESSCLSTARLLKTVSKTVEDLQAGLSNGKLGDTVEKAVDDLQAVCVDFAQIPTGREDVAATLVDAVNETVEDLQVGLDNRVQGVLPGITEKAVVDLKAACVYFS